MPKRGRYLVEDFPELNIGDLVAAAGGRKLFKQAQFFDVDLPDSKRVRLYLVRQPATFGGEIFFLKCPTCGEPARVLRVVPWGKGLACGRDFRKRSVKYKSQIISRYPAQCSSEGVRDEIC